MQAFFPLLANPPQSHPARPATSEADAIMRRAIVAPLPTTGPLTEAVQRALQGPSNYPDSFREMLNLAHDSRTPPVIAARACLGASHLALCLNDVGRMDRVTQISERLQNRFEGDPSLLAWFLPITLNRAHLSRQLGVNTARSLYRQAAQSLEDHSQFTRLAIQAYARLAVEHELVGAFMQAEFALQRAMTLLGDDTAHQDVSLAAAQITLLRKDAQRALQWARNAQQGALTTGDRYVEVEALRVASKAHYAMGDTTQAHVCLMEAKLTALSHHLYPLLHYIALDHKEISQA